VRILTPDKDLGQCLAGDRVVQVDRRNRAVINEAEFRKRRGFAPESMPDFLGLAGDSADGFPGLPGFGEKSASLLLGVYPHIEQIPRFAHEWKIQPRGALQLATTLHARRDEVLLYRKLATLVDTIPVANSLEEIAFNGVPQKGFESWCDRMGVERLKTTPRRWMAG
jgi:5'-3' exonuclease